jgi:ABC-type nitrate/sulfonate/bicarbonate transport system substrate-binding protein
MFNQSISRGLGRRSLIQFFITCMWTLMFCLSGSTALRAGAETTPIVLQFSGPQDISLAGALVASKEGFFAQQGLSVKLQKIQPGDVRSDDGPAITIRLENARDFLIARAAGTPIVAIAGNYVDSSVTFFFRRNLNIRSAQDLAGKSIGYDPASDAGLLFEWFLAKSSVARSSITEVPSNPGLKGLLDGTVDVVVGHSGIENLRLEKAGFDYGTLDPRAYGVHTLGTVYVTSESNVRQTPDALIRFLRALIAGWDYTYAKPDQAVAEIATLMDSAADPSVLKRSLEQQREFLRPGGARFGEALRSRWSDLYTFMSQRRLIRGSIDLSKATDTKLLTEAYRARLGPTNTAD